MQRCPRIPTYTSTGSNPVQLSGGGGGGVGRAVRAADPLEDSPRGFPRPVFTAGGGGASLHCIRLKLPGGGGGGGGEGGGRGGGWGKATPCWRAPDAALIDECIDERGGGGGGGGGGGKRGGMGGQGEGGGRGAPASVSQPRLRGGREGKGREGGRGGEKEGGGGRGEQAGRFGKDLAGLKGEGGGEGGGKEGRRGGRGGGGGGG